MSAPTKRFTKEQYDGFRRETDMLHLANFATCNVTNAQKYRDSDITRLLRCCESVPDLLTMEIEARFEKSLAYTPLLAFVIRRAMNGERPMIGIATRCLQRLTHPGAKATMQAGIDAGSWGAPSIEWHYTDPRFHAVATWEGLTSRGEASTKKRAEQEAIMRLFLLAMGVAA